VPLRLCWYLFRSDADRKQGGKLRHDQEALQGQCKALANPAPAPQVAAPWVRTAVKAGTSHGEDHMHEIIVLDKLLMRTCLLAGADAAGAHGGQGQTSRAGRAMLSIHTTHEYKKLISFANPRWRRRGCARLSRRTSRTQRTLCPETQTKACSRTSEPNY